MIWSDLRAEEPFAYFKTIEDPPITVDIKWKFLEWPAPLFISTCSGSSAPGEEDKIWILAGLGNELVLFKVNTYHGPIEEWGLLEGEYLFPDIIGGASFGTESLQPEIFVTNGGLGSMERVGAIIDVLELKGFTLLKRRTQAEILEIAANNRCEEIE